jgi:hypothetical protein
VGVVLAYPLEEAAFRTIVAELVERRACRQVVPTPLLEAT